MVGHLAEVEDSFADLVLRTVQNLVDHPASPAAVDLALSVLPAAAAADLALSVLPVVAAAAAPDPNNFAWVVLLPEAAAALEEAVYRAEGAYLDEGKEDFPLDLEGHSREDSHHNSVEGIVVVTGAFVLVEVVHHRQIGSRSLHLDPDSRHLQRKIFQYFLLILLLCPKILEMS